MLGRGLSACISSFRWLSLGRGLVASFVDFLFMSIGMVGVLRHRWFPYGFSVVRGGFLLFCGRALLGLGLRFRCGHSV